MRSDLGCAGLSDTPGIFLTFHDYGHPSTSVTVKSLCWSLHSRNRRQRTCIDSDPHLIESSTRKIKTNYFFYILVWLAWFVVIWGGGVLFLRRGFPIYLRLALNCLCSPGWSETLDASVFLVLGHATMSGSHIFFFRLETCSLTFR